MNIHSKLGLRKTRKMKKKSAKKSVKINVKKSVKKSAKKSAKKGAKKSVKKGVKKGAKRNTNRRRLTQQRRVVGKSLKNISKHKKRVQYKGGALPPLIQDAANIMGQVGNGATNLYNQYQGNELAPSPLPYNDQYMRYTQPSGSNNM